MRTWLVASCVICLAGPATGPARVHWWPAAASDVPPHVIERIGDGTTSAVEGWLAEGRRETETRIADGAWDHAVAFALQSRTFTTAAPIEPALSATRYVDTGVIPDDVRHRLRSFVRAVTASPVAFRWLPATPPPPELDAELERAYVRGMQFLQRQTTAGPDADRVAVLYETRGLSTDTSIEVGYAVHDGLGVAAALHRGKVRRVLVVGPGLELAPRTGFDDSRLGQSYQPVAVVDSLRRLGVAHADLQVDIVDVNAAVVQHFRERSPVHVDAPLVVGTHLSDKREGRFTAGFMEYLTMWGNAALAADLPMRRAADGRWQGRMLVPASVRQRLHAQAANIATDVPSHAAYDLVVATNVLTYLDAARMLMALSVVQRALVPGGVLLHNDRRTTVAGEAGREGLPIVQVRTVHFTEPGPGRLPVYDVVVVHQKAAGA